MDSDPDQSKESRLADYILPASIGMIGVCVTVISVTQLIPKYAISSLADEILAIDSLMFLVSAILSYVSVRHAKAADKYERVSDIFFMLGLAILVIVGFIVSFELLIK